MLTVSLGCTFIIPPSVFSTFTVFTGPVGVRLYICNGEMCASVIYVIQSCTFLTRVTRRVLLVEQELLTLPKHMSSPTGFRGVGIAQSLVLYVEFCRPLYFCPMWFWPLHCLVSSKFSLIIDKIYSLK